ncbi:MAG: flagellar motor switch protein FliN [Deltaproteobacteria bacterium]|nr:flagellar motor switch protein FliN [Deltaproteobacteria bacterium]
MKASAKAVEADKADDSTEKDEDISWDDVQEGLNGSANPVSEREVSTVQFEEVQGSERRGNSLELDFLLDIPLEMTVELGRCKMLINDLLHLGQGSVLELTKLAGEPMDVFVNNRLIARGEVVVVNEKFGVRLTDVVSHVERINKLK